MPSPAATTALRAAVEPLAAYVARTPAGNRHADAIAAAVDAVADYVEEVEAENEQPPGPDWEAITERMAAYIDTSTHRPNALADRVAAQLAQPHLQARAAGTLLERLVQSRYTSHHLGTPDLYAALPPQ